ncbi:MAG: amidohydrolase family protein, partial [Pirellulaceae bacterium]
MVQQAKIVTVDKDFRIVEAMALAGNRIVALGSQQELRPWIGPDTEVVDMEGRMVLPGLIDSHVHAGNASMYEADHPIPAMESIADVLAYVRERAQVVPRGEW